MIYMPFTCCGQPSGKLLTGSFMLHKILNSEVPRSALTHNNGLHLASHASRSARSTSTVELILIAARRCSAFFAEAAVLVLVFGILDFCLLKGRIELSWIVGALAISLGLLGGSIAMDFTAQRWARACP
jgi:hypothetical protein